MQLVIKVDIEAIELVAMLDEGDSGISELAYFQVILFQLSDFIFIVNCFVIRAYGPQAFFQDVVSFLEELISGVLSFILWFILINYCNFIILLLRLL